MMYTQMPVMEDKILQTKKNSTTNYSEMTIKLNQHSETVSTETEHYWIYCRKCFVSVQ